MEAPGIVGAVLSIYICIFWNADKLFHASFRTRVAKFLMGESVNKESHDLTFIFAALFSKIFGHKVWHWRFFLASIITSITSLMVMTVVWFILNDIELKDLMEKLITILLLWTLLNFIQDYLSLVETRFIIEKMQNKSVASVMFWLLFDLVFTSIIIVGSIYALLFVFSLVPLLKNLEPLDIIISSTYAALSMESNTLKGMIGIVIYTTYATSVWIWLYIMSVIIMRIPFVMSKLRFVLRVDDRPFRSLGVVLFVPGIICAAIISQS